MEIKDFLKRKDKFLKMQKDFISYWEKYGNIEKFCKKYHFEKTILKEENGNVLLITRHNESVYFFSNAKGEGEDIYKEILG